MLLKLTDDREFWNEEVHLSSEPTIIRANLLKLLLTQGIQKEMNKVDEIKRIAEQLEKLTGKKIAFQEAEGEVAPATDSTPDAIDNATRFANSISLFGALSKQLESAVGVIGAKQEQNTDSPALLAQIGTANQGLEQIIKALEAPAPQPVAEEAFLEEDLFQEIEGQEPIQFFAPKGTAKKLKSQAKQAGKFTMSDYLRDKLGL